MIDQRVIVESVKLFNSSSFYRNLEVFTSFIGIELVFCENLLLLILQDFLTIRHFSCIHIRYFCLEYLDCQLERPKMANSKLADWRKLAICPLEKYT